jgi:ATP-dependent DNA helicase RecQ
VRVTDDAKTAHLLVVNHALLLAEPKRLPPYRRLVVDEAHALEDVATQSLTEEVSQEALEVIFNQLHDEHTRQGAIPRLMAQSRDSMVALLCRRVFGALDRLRVLVPDFGRHLAAFIRACEGKIDPRYGAAFRLEGDPSRVEATRWSRVEQARKQLFDVHLAELIAALSGLIEVTQALPMLPYKDVTLEDLQRALEALLEQQQLQQRIVRVSNRKHVYWLEVEPATTPANDQGGVGTEGNPVGRWAMKCAPIRVDNALARHYAELDTAVFVSATLSIRGGDFSFFVDRLGLGPFLGSGNIHAVESDLDYGNNALLGLVNYLEYTPVERTMKSFCEEFAKELQLLLDFTDGRALVLFTARDRAVLAYQRCMDALASKGIPLYCQLPGLSRRQLQEDFAEQVESVLFGLQSFWEGVDVPGESLSFVVMEKLPFPFLFDPVFKARREDVVQQGQHEFNDFVFPLMAIRFKQGFGRLIRRKSDRGAVLLMDKRIHRKEYKYELLASLPGYLPRDEQAERSRRLFYQSLIERMPGLIHAESKADLLASLPEDLPPDLIERLRAFALPERIAAEDYAAWRPTLLEALQDVFRFSGFRSAEQEEVIQQMLAGRDVLALLPTGSGKSLCFQLTALLRDGVTLVFSPLIALMRDQVQALQGRGIEIVAAIYSGQPADEREETFARMRSGKVRLVYISPERLRDPHLLETLRSTRIIQVVVDEAHCVAMWGPSFRPDFLYLPRLFEHIGSRPPLAAFTATATPEVRTVIRDALAMQDMVQVVASFDRPELKFVVCNAHSRYNSIRTKNDRFKVLLKLVQAADRTRESVLVYVATTVEAELLARRLRSAGYDARPYHGKMSAADRDSVQELFMDDHINIVVCTKAFGMGIDKSDIRYVIHMHMPGDLESYFQEAGRAGRDGQESYCILLYHRSDRDVHDFFIEAGMPDEELLNALIERLTAMAGETLYLDTIKLGESLGMDEVQLKVSLHLLEQAGFIERGADFTLRGSLTLRETPDVIERHLTETKPLSASLFRSIVTTLGWEPFRRLELDLAQAADRLGIPPGALDELLVRLAVADLAIYRPWEKGSIVTKGRQLAAGKAFREEVASVAHLERLHGKLDRMVGYAEATAGQGCRRALILRYFGERWEHGNCGGCDHCTPEAEYPWSQLTARDTANLYDYFDPAFTILEVVKWNQDQLREGRNPFSTSTLINVLKGSDFQRSGGNRSRMRALRACPQWGVFDALPRRDQVIERCLDRLERERYIAKRTAEFVGDAGTVTYAYPDLLDQGREQLLNGELLQWALD